MQFNPLCDKVSLDIFSLKVQEVFTFKYSFLFDFLDNNCFDFESLYGSLELNLVMNFYDTYWNADSFLL